MAFIPKERESEILAAIEAAEKNTSGEVRLHVEALCPGDPLKRAVALFDDLGMHRTEARNGVLIYIAWKDRKTAIFGDAAIHALVGQDFWDEDIRILTARFARGEVVEGLTEVIARVGDKLHHHFPYTAADRNELSNDISFGDGGRHA